LSDPVGYFSPHSDDIHCFPLISAYRIHCVPILGSTRIRRDSGSSSIKKSSEFAVWDDIRFHAKTPQLLASELLGLDKNRQVPSIGVFRI
ncbi:hypothetical protein M569_15300, partial [Genlisea aurea]